MAKQNGISVNQFIVIGVAEKISALDTAGFFPSVQNMSIKRLSGNFFSVRVGKPLGREMKLIDGGGS